MPSISLQINKRPSEEAVIQAQETGEAIVTTEYKSYWYAPEDLKDKLDEAEQKKTELIDNARAESAERVTLAQRLADEKIALAKKEAERIIAEAKDNYEMREKVFSKYSYDEVNKVVSGKRMEYEPKYYFMSLEEAPKGMKYFHPLLKYMKG
jgi:cell division septum initiation protein DivIVA